MKISWLKPIRSKAAQIYDYGPEFCFISKELKQCHPFVFCKDFLQDSIYGTLNKKTVSIYDFTFNPNDKPPIDLECTRIAFANTGDKLLKDKIPNVIDFINQIEIKLKLKKTIVSSVENVPASHKKSGIFVFEGSKQWMNSPPLLSMYTLFLRASCVHKIGNSFQKTIKDIVNHNISCYQENDSSQLDEAAEGIDNILKIGYRKFFYIDPAKNYPAKVNADAMHNDFGICGFSQEFTKEHIPFWHRKKVRDLLKKPLD